MKVEVGKNAITIALLMLFGICAAVYAGYVHSQNLRLSSELERVELEFGTADEEISAGSGVLDEYEHRLKAAQLEIERLGQQMRNLIDNQPRRFPHPQYLRLDDGRHLRYSTPSMGLRWVDYIHLIEEMDGWEFSEYSAIFARQDGTNPAFSWAWAVSQPSISPCNNLLTFVPIGEDWHTTLVIYDLRIMEYQTRSGLIAHWDRHHNSPHMTGDSSIRHAAWLNERTILTLHKFSYGTPLRGGTLYAYDIYDRTLTSLDIPIPNNDSIFSLRIAGGMVHMDILHQTVATVYYYIYPHAVPVSEIYHLIETGETRAVERQD